MTFSIDTARSIGEQALAHIAADAELTTSLLGMTGAQPQDLRAMAGSDGLALACLDVVMASDDHVLAFSDATGLRPRDIALAHAMLSGPQM